MIVRGLDSEPKIYNLVNNVHFALVYEYVVIVLSEICNTVT